MRILQALVFVLVAAVASAQTPPAPASIPPPSNVAAAPADAVKTASGLATKVLAPGTGKERPAKDDVVTIHYTGWKTDGTMFDSSVARGKPASFPVARVIPGFSEGLQLMVQGEKRRLWIPEPLAYKGAREPKGMLVFDIELIDIPSIATRAPADVKAPPADAKKTASGLAYKVLKQGTGGRHPKANSQVTVHYTGWTTDGKMFDSSVTRGEPITFGLDGVIPGWTEGVQLMYEGEKTRFWIPENLAYKGKSAPYGLLVFDVELIKIQ
jgi:FKBP-type peptidyl-prolyl cis-trans isomerase